MEKTLNDYDVTQQYKNLAAKYQTIPFANKFTALQPDEYVIAKALDGLFLTLGQEESKIRTDPNARVTDLLREVFE